jgi:hypothetical protein
MPLTPRGRRWSFTDHGKPDDDQVIDLPEEHQAVSDQVDRKGEVRQRKQDNELWIPMHPAVLQ